MPTSVKAALEGGYGGEWSSPRALAEMSRDGTLDQVPYLAECYRIASRPIDRDRLVQRLTALGMTMAPNRPPAEASIWVRETARLLADLAEDIVCGAIDDCQREMKFLPTVAEIRERADPAMRRRRSIAARLDAMERYLASGQPIPTLLEPIAPSPPPTPQLMTHDEVEEMNSILCRIGAVTRYRPDGSRYEVTTSGAEHIERGPPRMPTRADYIAMGVDPAVFDQSNAQSQAA